MAQAKKEARAYSAAHFVLELGEKEHVGFPRSVEGGNLKAEIMSYQAGNSHAVWKQLSKPKIDDLKVQVGMGMSEIFYDWLSGFFEGKGVRKSGAIVAGDFHFVERARRTFSEALISEIAFPKLDATDRNACYMTVTLTPESMQFENGSGQKLDTKIGSTVQKLWTSANFRFEIDGFQDQCKRVMQVEGFSIKQEIMEYPAGNLRQPIRVPGRIQWPDISFYVPEPDATTFIDHFKKTVINGEPQGERRTGTLEYLDHEGMELAEIHLDGIDISAIEVDKSDATSEDIKKVKITISVESMKFEYGDVAVLE